jgi:hypothetical protein
MYPRIVILSLAKRLENLLMPFFMYGPEITTCRYKGLLQVFIML